VIPLSLVASAFLAMGLFFMTSWVVVPAYLLYYSCYAAAQGAFWLIPSDRLRGRSAAAGLAAVGSIGMLGAFIGPFAWGVAKDHTGTYQVGLLSLSVCFTAAAILLLLIRRKARSARSAASSAAAIA
jgi:MFS transporter, ACS family, tartrate transporter